MFKKIYIIGRSKSYRSNFRFGYLLGHLSETGILFTSVYLDEVDCSLSSDSSYNIVNDTFKRLVF